MNSHTVYDVGACYGEWTSTLQSSCLSSSKFYVFEGNPDWKPHLDQIQGVSNYTMVLSSPWQKTVKWWQINSTADSYYKENSQHYDHTTYKVVSCKTLDQMVVYYDLPQPSLLKLDTQGSELDILSGSNSVLSQTDLVLLECPIIKYNQGAPNIQQYLDFMQYRGFVPCYLAEEHYAYSCLLQIDIMFINLYTRSRLYGNDLPNYF